MQSQLSIVSYNSIMQTWVLLVHYRKMCLIMGSDFLQLGCKLYKFSEIQREAHKFREGTVHEMCNEAGYGSLGFRPILDRHIVKVKVY
jgi:hypothetical protein